jgi:hypothetical protein
MARQHVEQYARVIAASTAARRVAS